MTLIEEHKLYIQRILRAFKKCNSDNDIKGVIEQILVDSYDEGYKQSKKEADGDDSHYLEKRRK